MIFTRSRICSVTTTRGMDRRSPIRNGALVFKSGTRSSRVPKRSAYELDLSIECGASDSDSARRVSNDTGGHATDVATQHRTSAGAHHDVIDPVVASVVNQLARRICRFENVVGDALRRHRNFARPMLEFHEPAQMRIASLRVLSFIQRKTGNFQHIDAGKAGTWFRHEDPSAHAPARGRWRPAQLAPLRDDLQERGVAEVA